MTDREKVQRLLRAALREAPGPYRVNLALKELEKIQAEEREAELQAIAAYHGQAG